MNIYIVTNIHHFLFIIEPLPHPICCMPIWYSCIKTHSFRHFLNFDHTNKLLLIRKLIAHTSRRVVSGQLRVVSFGTSSRHCILLLKRLITRRCWWRNHRRRDRHGWFWNWSRCGSNRRNFSFRYYIYSAEWWCCFWNSGWNIRCPKSSVINCSFTQNCVTYIHDHENE